MHWQTFWIREMYEHEHVIGIDIQKVIATT